MIKMAKIQDIQKVKECHCCHRLFDQEDLSLRQICVECRIERMQRWVELQREAKRKFDEEWP